MVRHSRIMKGQRPIRMHMNIMIKIINEREGINMAEISTALNGMKDICKAVGFSEATVLAFIRDEGFPATKIRGIWISDTEEVAKWRRNKINQQPEVDNSKTNKKIKGKSRG